MIEVRRPDRTEYTLVRNVVQTVVDETYGGLWAPPPLQIDEEDWSLAWIAIMDGHVAGMTLTNEEWVSDLWVLKLFRSKGIGSALLARAETEISQRGYARARLRLVQTNTKVRAFYVSHNWTPERDFSHEHLPIIMTEMVKTLR